MTKENLGLDLHKKGKRKVVLGTLIALLIALSPYFFYLYEAVPKKQIWDTMLFTYDAKFYEDANWAMWLVTGKAIPLYLLIIWFFSCRHWWYHVLIIPIVMYSYQLINVVNDDINLIDENQLAFLLPIIALIVPSIYLVRARIFNRINNVNKTLQDLEDELKLKPKTFKEKLKDYF